MDDIYGDLENYNDVNAIEELRNENMQLKFRLEEYSSKMEKLQKDFDHVSSEYKRLEINYSSLLKTAKAEIERKTQIITNLNKEKDMMVLNSIQNSNQRRFIRRNVPRDKSNSRKSQNDSDFENTQPATKGFPEVKRVELERKEDIRLHSTDTVSSENTDNTNKAIENKPAKLDPYEKSNEIKENFKSKKAQSLRSRRKSMPVLGKPKFSSDEDDDNSADEINKRERLSRDDRNRKMFDRHKPIHKVSETSGIDDKYSSNHESSRETYYKGKPHRYSDKYRSANERFDPKYKKHYSPERNRRAPRDYPDNQYQRTEFGRHRVLESPPIERYDPRRQRDKRPNYEKDIPHDPRHARRQDRLTVKHKASSDYDEPYNKRVRTDSCSKSVESVKRKHQDQSHPKDSRSPAFSEHLQNASCQSPDYIHPDAVSTVPVKEIMSIAATKLEDPRLASKKYVKNIDGNKVILSTVTGRKVDLKVISDTTWNEQQVELPQALQKPPISADELIQKLYMDINNPESNMSLESGEVHSETNDGPITDYVKKSFFQEYENEKHKEIVSIYDIVVKENTKDAPPIKEDNSKPRDSNYKIPKVKKYDDKASAPANPLGLLLSQMHAVCGVPKINTGPKLNVDATFSTDDEKDYKNKSNSKQTQELGNQRKLSPREIVEGDLELSDETSDVVDKKQKNKVKSKKAEISKKKCDQSEKVVEIKTTEPKELPKENVKSKISKISEDSKNEKSEKVEVKTIQTVKELPKDSFKPSKSKISEKNNMNEKIEELKSVKIVTEKDNVKSRKSKNSVKNLEMKPLDEVVEEPPENKKSKRTKRKIVKDKEVSPKDTVKSNKTDKIDVPEKKTRGKKPKESKSPHRKTNFRELFGDSCSLITPEDLGLAAIQANTVEKNKYVPIFEDAQDAVDVNVKATVDIAEHNVEPTKENEVVENPPTIVNTATDDVNVEVPQICPVQEITPNMEVVDEAVTKEPDVKTVIISTGIQPVIENIKSNDNEVDLQSHQIKLLNTPVHALATSTPYKSNVLIEKKVETSNSSVSAQNELSSTDQSITNGLKENEDVPDVRIFVKRRRKLRK